MTQLVKSAKFMNNNLASVGSALFSSDPTGFPNLFDENLSKTWNPTGTSEFIELDLLTNANDVSFVGLIGPHNEPFSLSSGATVTIRMDNVDTAWGSAPVVVNADITQRGIFHFFDLADCNYRFVRIEIDDPFGEMKFSYLYVGNYINTTRNITLGYRKERVDPTEVQETESGRRYFNIKDRYERWTGMNIPLAPRSERLEIEQMWHDFGRFNPFFLSIDPGSDISDDLGELTRFVYFDSQVAFNHVIRDLYNISLTVRDVI